MDSLMLENGLKAEDNIKDVRNLFRLYKKHIDDNIIQHS